MLKNIVDFENNITHATFMRLALEFGYTKVASYSDTFSVFVRFLKPDGTTVDVATSVLELEYCHNPITDLYNRCRLHLLNNIELIPKE